MINENGEIKTSIAEENNEILEGFTLGAREKCLRKLNDKAAFNVASYPWRSPKVSELSYNIKATCKKSL